MDKTNHAFPDLTALRERLRAFAEERDWEKFHTPKNLATALAVEAAELLEHFQWLSPEESENLPRETRDAVKEELADVLIYLVRLADRFDVNLLDIAAQKIEKNAAKYPAEVVSGRAAKYTTY